MATAEPTLPSPPAGGPDSSTELATSGARPPPPTIRRCPRVRRSSSGSRSTTTGPGTGPAGDVRRRDRLPRLRRPALPPPDPVAEPLGADSQQLRDEDVMGRRRAWYWRKKLRLAIVFVVANTIVWLFRGEGTWWSTVGFILEKIGEIITTPASGCRSSSSFPLHRELRDLHGPDADHGDLADPGLRAGRRAVGRPAGRRPRPGRGEGRVHRVVTLWQSGEAFEARRRQARARPALPRRARHRQDHAGGGRSRPASTRRSSRSPARLAQTFIGIDAIIVRFLAWKAKRLARKWAASASSSSTRSTRSGCAGRRSAAAPIGGFYADRHRDHLFYGPHGALNPSGDLILETRRWRERLFEHRAPERPARRA